MADGSLTFHSGRNGSSGSSASTYPTIRISTIDTDQAGNSVSVEFEYLPESMSFSLSAQYEKIPIPLTAARLMIYSYSNIDEINVDVKVVAGCNNAIVAKSNDQGTIWSVFTSAKAVKTTRNDLITIAKLLYSLALPPTNDAGGPGAIPPRCNLTIGPYCNCMGYVQTVSIKYAGPYDYDGSPTEMDVSLNFCPTEFAAGNKPLPEGQSPDLQSSQTMSGVPEVTQNIPYAIWVGQNNTSISPLLQPAPLPPNQGFEASEYSPGNLSASQVQQQEQVGALSGQQPTVVHNATYTEDNIREAYHLSPDTPVTRFRVTDANGQEVGPYFYNIGGVGNYIQESVVNEVAFNYQTTVGFKTPTNTVIK